MESYYDNAKMLEIGNAKIAKRSNFTGVEIVNGGRVVNEKDTKNFLVIIDDHSLAIHLMADGWNVKRFKPTEDNSEPDYYLSVEVSWKREQHIPTVWRIQGRTKEQLTDDTIKVLDQENIVSADLIIRPYEWEPGRIKAYLKKGYFVVEEDRFASKYDFDFGEEADESDDLPF